MTTILNPYKEAIKRLDLSYPDIADLAEPYGLSVSYLTGRNRGQYIGRIANGMVSPTNDKGSLSAVGAAIDAAMRERNLDPDFMAREWLDNYVYEAGHGVALEQPGFVSWATRLELHQRLVRKEFIDKHGSIGYDYVIGAGWRAFAGVGLNTQYAVAKALQVPITWIQAWVGGDFYPALHSAIKEALGRE